MAADRHRHPHHRRQDAALAAAARHGRVPLARGAVRRARRVRLRARHRRAAPHRPGPARLDRRRARLGRRPAAAEHGRLLHGPRRRADREAGARGVRDRLGQARGDRRRAHAAARRARAARGRRGARRRRLRRAPVHERRPDPGAPAGGRRLRRGDAARLADRLRHGPAEHVQPAADPRARGRAGDPRRRRRHRIRRGAGDGARLRRGPVRERDLARRGPGDDGARDPARHRGRPARLPRRPDPPSPVRAGLHARGGRRPSSVDIRSPRGRGSPW